MINKSFPGTIDEKTLVTKPNKFQMTANNLMALQV